MKKSILNIAFLASGLFIASLVFSNCDGKKEHSHDEDNQTAADSTHNNKMDSTQMAYSCPMHPEVTGKEGDKCSKCGMMLEKVKSKEGHDHH